MGNFEKAQKVLKLAHTMDQARFQTSAYQMSSSHSDVNQMAIQMAIQMPYQNASLKTRKSEMLKH